MNSEQQGRTVPQRIGMGLAFIAFSAVFGPWLLMRMPRFGGYDRRQWIAIGIGFAAWGLVLEGIFGIPSGIMEAVYPR